MSKGKSPTEIVSFIDPAYQMIKNLQTPSGQPMVTDAIVAGGALRSLYFNKPINDIDVFLHSPLYLQPSSTQACVKLFNAVNAYNEKVRGLPPLLPEKIREYAQAELQRKQDKVATAQGEYEEEAAQYILCTFEIPVEVHRLNSTPHPIQYINVTHTINLTDCVNTFDVGINQLFYDGRRIRLTANFNKDVNNKTLTWYNSGLAASTHTIVHRLHKMQQIFPEFTMVVDTQSLVDEYSKKQKK